MIASERRYPIRRPMAAALAGAAVAVLGGLIGLGGAEFRLPLLIAVFAVFPHRAIPHKPANQPGDAGAGLNPFSSPAALLCERDQGQAKCG